MGCYRNETICIFRRDDKDLEFSVDDGKGNPVDISEVQSIEWKMARNVNAVPVISKSWPDDIVIDGTGTKFTVPLSSADTDVDPGSYYHEAQIVSGDGDTYTVQYGSIRIRQDLINGGS